jgi:hypothetical protein
MAKLRGTPWMGQWLDFSKVPRTWLLAGTGPDHDTVVHAVAVSSS